MRVAYFNELDSYEQVRDLDTVDIIKAQGMEVVVYEPTLKEGRFYNSKEIRDFEEFTKICDVIAANRWDDVLEDVKNMTFTRD